MCFWLAMMRLKDNEMALLGQQDDYSKSYRVGYYKGLKEGLINASKLEMKIRKWVHDYSIHYDEKQLMLKALEKYSDEIEKLIKDLT